MSLPDTTGRPRGWRTPIGVALAVASIAVAVPMGQILPVLAAVDSAASGHRSINGPGHQAVLTDSDVLVYHYYPDDGEGPTAWGYCTLGINRIDYDDDGWPYVSRP